MIAVKYVRFILPLLVTVSDPANAYKWSATETLAQAQAAPIYDGKGDTYLQITGYTGAYDASGVKVTFTDEITATGEQYIVTFTSSSNIGAGFIDYNLASSVDSFVGATVNSAVSGPTAVYTHTQTPALTLVSTGGMPAPATGVAPFSPSAFVSAADTFSPNGQLIFSSNDDYYIPEPGSALLIWPGLAGLVMLERRWRKGLSAGKFPRNQINPS